MNFDELIQLQVLKLKAMSHGVSGANLLDAMIEQGQVPDLRQMCAKVSPALYDRLENVTGLLDMSKRQFIEGAVADAIARAEEAIARSINQDQRSL